MDILKQVKIKENEFDALGQYKQIIELELQQDSIDYGEIPGLRAIHVAARAGEIDLTKRLLSKKANVNFRTSKGLTPLHYGVLSGKEEIIRLLLMFGAKINQCSTIDGKTPLYTAASKGELEILRCLLSAGANPLIPDSNGILPKQAALEAGYSKCSAVLEHHELLQKRATPGFTQIYIPEFEYSDDST